MEVVAAAIAVDVQNLAAGEHAGGEPAFKRVGAEFCRPDAASRHLCALEAGNARDGKRKRFDNRYQRFQRRVGTGRKRLRAEAAGMAERLAEARMEHTGKQLLARQRRERFAPCLQKRPHLRRGILPQKIEQQPGPLRLSRCPRKRERSRAGNARLGKLHLARVLQQRSAVCAQTDAAVGPDALQPPDGGRVRADLREAGVQRRAAVAELRKKLVAGHRSAQRLSRAAAAGNDQLISKIRAAVRARDLIAARFFLHALRVEAADELHARLRSGEPQHVHNAVGLIGQGIDPPGRLCRGQKAQRVEKVQRRRPVKARKRGAGKARVLSVIVHRGQVEVRQVAPAVAGGEQLAPDARLPFENGDGIPFILRGGKRGHQSAGSAAENQNLHVLLLGVRGMEYVQFLCSFP